LKKPNFSRFFKLFYYTVTADLKEVTSATTFNLLLRSRYWALYKNCSGLLALLSDLLQKLTTPISHKDWHYNLFVKT